MVTFIYFNIRSNLFLAIFFEEGTLVINKLFDP
jgi:hypothetical protein